MLYQRSLEIEQRLDAVLRLIHTGNYSTPALAKEVGVSIATRSAFNTAATSMISCNTAPATGERKPVAARSAPEALG